MRITRLALMVAWLALPAALVRAQEPDAGELLGQAVKQISEFNTARYTEGRKADLARYVPSGKEVSVTLFYRVVKPAPGEEMEIRILDDIHPFPVKYLAERGVEYVQEEAKIIGTGEYVRKGAPAYPDFSRQPQVGWIEWNQWRQKSQSWAQDHPSAPAPDKSRAESGKPYVPQVDMKWLQRNEAVLGSAAQTLRGKPDPSLGAAFATLREIDARASGPAWAPQPGGVLLSPTAAGAVGDGLLIDRVDYDPASGKVRVTGNRSSIALDADILGTALRLACGYKGVPYFSLDPHKPFMTQEWYAEREQVNEELTARLKTDADFAKSFEEKCFEERDIEGNLHRICLLDAVDSQLAAALDSRLPMLMDLRFHPKWLARTRLGEVLFIADQSIKELWHGAAVWGNGPSRALRVEGAIAPKFWSPHRMTIEDLERSIGVKIAEESRGLEQQLLGPSLPLSVRWWFTPGGNAKEGARVLDLSQVQPILQTERRDYSDQKVIYELGIPGSDVKIKQEMTIPGDPLNSVPEDPWSKSIVDDVNHRFDAYAQAMPEWAALREIFRAYVFAIWLEKHDPDAARRLLADLPPPHPPSRPLPPTWPDPRLMVVRMDKDGAKIDQISITGGVGFERPLLAATPWSGQASGGGSSATLGSFSSGGFVPEWADDDAQASPEGYAAWRQRLLLERGWLWAWMTAWLAPSEIAFFVALALAMTGVTLLRARRKAKLRFTSALAAVSLLDVLMTAVVFVMVAVYPDTYKQRTEPFTGWWVAILFYAAVFIGADRAGRFMLTGVVMTVVMIWTAFTPGFGEAVRGWIPHHLAVPPLEGAAGGPLAADTVYAVQALADGLPICRAIEPHYAWYPLLWLSGVIGFLLEIRLHPGKPAKPPVRPAAVA
jgi:hypothetical protein